MAEGGTASITFSLSTQPSDDVTVTIAYGGTSSSTTFTDSNWNQAKTVMITAMQDTDSDDEDIVVLITANGGGYDAVTTAVALRVDDDEDPAVAEEPEEPEATASGLPVFLLVPTVAFPQVAIYSNNSGVPGSELCQVERLTGYETGLVLGTGDWPDEMYAGACAGETLAASTTYWVVFKSFEPYPQSFYRAGHANSTNHDASSTSGWSIGDATHYRIYTAKSTTNWRVATGRQPLAVGIYAAPN